MATRSTIKIEGINYAKIYKHWDGYPDAMIYWLTDFNDRFNKERGHDPSYKFAQLLRFSQKEGDKYHLDMSDTTGWGVVPFDEDLGAEYEYTLTDKGVKINEL